MKFKKGDIVFINDNNTTDHGFECGEKVEIISVCANDYFAKSLSRPDCWYVRDEDLTNDYWQVVVYWWDKVLFSSPKLKSEKQAREWYESLDFKYSEGSQPHFVIVNRSDDEIFGTNEI